MPASATIADLRRLLADRFPAQPARTARCVPTGIASIDELLNGGVATGSFTEIVSSGPSCGGQLITAALLHSTRVAQQRLALLDAANAFDAEAFDDALLAHLIWFRGRQLKTFWLAADIVLRDSNFSATILDLRGLPERDVRRTPNTTWYRLQRAIEQSETTVLVHTDFPLVPCVAHRLILSQPLTMAAFKTERDELQAALNPELNLQRHHGKIAG